MNTDQGKQKIVSIWEGSELIPGDGMNSDHSIRLSRGRVRADPRRQDQLLLKNRLFRGRVPAGPSRQDWLVPQKKPRGKGSSWSNVRAGPEFGRGPS